MSIHEVTAERALDAISDDDLRRGVGVLFSDAQRMIDVGLVDLVVLTARRLVCLYQLLIRAGMPPIEGCPTVSDRYLDANPQLDWSSTRVLLLDDSVVVGTTLVRIHDEFARCGAASVVCRSVCVDVDQRAGYLLEAADFTALHHRGTDAVQVFSREVVEALFEHQIPFFSDFPVTKALDLSTKAWNTFLDGSDWHVADVTAPLLSNDSVYALAQVPSTATYERFISRVPPEAAALLDSFKLRSFIARSKQGVRVVFVPIAMLAPCKPAALDDALRSVALHLRGADPQFGIDWASWPPVSKHRLLQIYLSACVLAEVWPRIAAKASRGNLGPADLEALPIALYFGPETDAVLNAFRAVADCYATTEAGYFTPTPSIRLDQPVPSELLRDQTVQDVLWEARELIAYTGYPDEPGPGELTKIGLIFAHAVSSIFGFLNREYELPQRAQIRALASRTEYARLFGDGTKRFLNQGFTARELTAALIPGGSASPWARSLLSLGIDIGNDLGIIVPVTRYDPVRDVVFRAYRLGETAQLADLPLPYAARVRRFDTFASYVTQGYPALGSSEPIRPRRWRRSRRHAWSLDVLRAAVLDAVPGELTSRFNGTVIEVGGETFDADLLSPLENDHRVAKMRIDRLSSSDQERLEPGALFTWTVFTRDHHGVQDNISRIRVQRPVRLNADRMRQRASALAYLADPGLDPPGGR